MTNKNLISKIFILTVLGLFLNLNIYSYICSNGAGTGYEETPGPGIQSMEEQSIEMYIVEGAGFYYAAVSDIDSLLRLYELQDLYGATLPLLQGPLDRAIFNLNYAIYTYERLIRKAENTPYNQAVVEKLAAFDYESYMTANNLNNSLFGQVEAFLKNGDITGIFKETHAKFTSLRETLKTAKDSLLKCKYPGLSDMWTLQEQCLETSYFGSCVARVFRQIQ